jgi:GDP-L-fucose synthase
LAETIFVTGASGMIGRVLVRKLKECGYQVLTDRIELMNQEAVVAYFLTNSIDYVIHLAALVGGINYNIRYPVEMLLNNMVMSNNVISTSFWHSIENLMFLSSSCIYPPSAKVPYRESDVLAGPIEPTNEGYAIAKIAGMKLCDYYQKQYYKNYTSLILSNAYGYLENEPLERLHAIPALMLKMHTAKMRGDKSVEVMGTGKPVRDNIHIDDIADAIIYMMNNFNEPGGINIGTNEHVSIRDLAYKIKYVVGYKGELIFTGGEDGMLEKYTDTQKADKLGWIAKVSLESGLEMMYKDYLCD